MKNSFFGRLMVNRDWDWTSPTGTGTGTRTGTSAGTDTRVMPGRVGTG